MRDASRLRHALWLLVWLTLSGVSTSAHGQAALPSAAPAAKPADVLTPAQAQQVLDVLHDEKKRAEFTQVLDSMVHAMPAADPAKAPLLPDSLGAQLLVEASAWIAGLADEAAATAHVASDLPLLGRWFSTTALDPAARSRMLDTAWKLAVVAGCALGIERLARWGLSYPRAGIERHAPLVDDPLADGDATPDGDSVEADTASIAAAETGETEMRVRNRRFSRAWRSLRRLPYVIADLILELIPVSLFALVGNLLLGIPLLGGATNARLVVLAVVNAYVACRVVMCLTRMFVVPYRPRLRLVHCTDATALYVTIWVRRLAVVAVFGFVLAEIGTFFGLYRTAHDTLLKLVGLVVHVMLIVIVLQKRAVVAAHIRARRNRTGVIATLLNRFAAVWHLVAIFYIVALWIVAAANIRDGYTRLLHFAVVTGLTMLAARLVSIVALGGLDRSIRIGPNLAARYPGLERRTTRYYPIFRVLLTSILVVVTGVVLLEAWGFGPLAYFTSGHLGQRVVSAIVTIGLVTLGGLAVWEAANASIENHLAALTRQAQIARSARLRTLLPMLRTALLVTLLIIVGLVALSEIGVNIAPLLAGAGVLGLAIGFGSQKLVQDLITGLFLLLENTMQVGDVVALGGLTGTVENLSIRTIRLRSLDGSVHIIPFSSVTTVTNQTRDFSYVLTDVPVGLDEEPDHAADLLRGIVKDMRNEPRWADTITADLDVMGVQSFDATNWLLRVRIRTTPSQRWPVSREFNRRIKYKFDELAIQSPLTSYKAQGWMPPGSERPIVALAPAAPHIEKAAE